MGVKPLALSPVIHKGRSWGGTWGPTGGAVPLLPCSPTPPQPVAESHVGLKVQWRRLWVACNFRRFTQVAFPPSHVTAGGTIFPRTHVWGLGLAAVPLPLPRDRRPGATPPFCVRLGCVLLSPGE